MSDFEQIQRVVNAYARGIDDRVPETLATEVFTPDADVNVGFGDLVGSEQIAREYRAEMEKIAASVHVNSNLDVHVEGDAAESKLIVTFWHWALGSAQDDWKVYLGEYTDRWARTESGWRIAHRRFRPLGPAA